MKNELKKIIAIVCAIFEAFFLWKLTNISGNTIVYVVLTIIIYSFIRNILDKVDKRKYIFCFVLALLFTIIEVFVASMNTYLDFDHLSKSLIIDFIGYIILIFFSLLFIFDIFSTIKSKVEESEPKNIKIFNESRLSFFINMALVIIAWLPYFLRYFPGLMTLDSCIQVAQAIGRQPFSNHHPIFHTLIITFFVNIGKNVLGTINYGVAIYTLAQMIMMAISFAFVLKYLAKKNVHFSIRILALLYYMFYPINALYAVTMWKDVLFAGIVPLFIIMCNEIITNPKAFLSSFKKDILFILIAVLTGLLRNNGIYVVILTFIPMFFILRKYWKRTICVFTISILVFFIIKAAIFDIFKVKNGRVAEMLSIPLQQIARVEKYYRDELDENTMNRINNFFTIEHIGDQYNPILSDEVKARLNDEYFNENKLEFIRLWGHLLVRYFQEYVESFIANSYGYYYPEASSWVANRTLEPNDMGIEQSPKIEGKVVSIIDSYIEKREVPIISMFFSIGMAVWFIVICLWYRIYKRDYKSVVMYLPIFILWLTIIASPVYCEYRYAYPIFTTLPIFFGLNFKNKMKGE